MYIYSYISYINICIYIYVHMYIHMYAYICIVPRLVQWLQVRYEAMKESVGGAIGG